MFNKEIERFYVCLEIVSEILQKFREDKVPQVTFDQEKYKGFLKEYSTYFSESLLLMAKVHSLSKHNLEKKFNINKVLPHYVKFEDWYVSAKKLSSEYISILVTFNRCFNHYKDLEKGIQSIWWRKKYEVNLNQLLVENFVAENIKEYSEQYIKEFEEVEVLRIDNVEKLSNDYLKSLEALILYDGKLVENALLQLSRTLKDLGSGICLSKHYISRQYLGEFIGSKDKFWGSSEKKWLRNGKSIFYITGQKNPPPASVVNHSYIATDPKPWNKVNGFVRKIAVDSLFEEYWPQVVENYSLVEPQLTLDELINFYFYIYTPLISIGSTNINYFVEEY